ncbi:hypothetical protein CRD60_06760 [Bifidobacterium aemilianum]|uniref:DUF7927 domain-containing protein n=1 Tax=Bifidobacterium aemilianum TaxID=2493120 RepID=A0A366K6T7_9BIFI|nr:hypothetical protein CRD60_06760 [Bifidobacterium aemilianum]
MRSKLHPAVIGLIALVVVLCLSLVAYGFSAGLGVTQPQSGGKLTREASVKRAGEDFPTLGQTARFGVANADRQGYGAAAEGQYLAYVQQQGVSGQQGDGSVALETFQGSYMPGSIDIGKWTGNTEYDGSGMTLPGTIVIPAPSDASGFGYGVALSHGRLIVSAKWSQQIFVYDMTGSLLRTISKPVDTARYHIGNFAESIAADGDTLLIGAPNSKVDDLEDAGMAFSLDLSDPSSLPQPLLAPKQDPSIKAGALAGQALAVSKTAYAIGAPGYITEIAGTPRITGLVQLFDQAGSLSHDLTVDTGVGSYPRAEGSSRAGLGRSLAFSGDGKTIYAGDPSWDRGTDGDNQVGRVLVFDTTSGAAGKDIEITDPAGASYVGGSVAVGKSAAGNDTLYVSYQGQDGSQPANPEGFVAGYAVTKNGPELRQTLKRFNGVDARFGSMGLLGGAIVPYSYTSNTGASNPDDEYHQRLLVTGGDYVYNFEDQLNLNLAKESDPPTGTRVFPGQDITYTLKIENPNPVSSSVHTTVSDDLSGVLDYAEGGQVSSLAVDPSTAGPAPVFDQAGKKITWTGDVPGRKTASITYKIKVKKSQDPLYYQGTIKNVFSSDRSTDQPSTEQKLGKVDMKKTLLDAHGDEVATANSVAYDQDYSYLLSISNHTDTDVDSVTMTDDLGKLMDKVDFDSSAVTSDPAAAGVTSYDQANKILTWTGPLAAHSTVKLNLPIHTHDAQSAGANLVLENFMTGDRGPDSNTVSNPLVGVSLDKKAQNASGVSIGSVGNGQQVHYQIVYTNTTGVTVYRAEISDDLTQVLANASVPEHLNATSSDATHVLAQPTFTSPHLQWEDRSGIKPGEVVTISYDVTAHPNVPKGASLKNSATSKQTTDNPSTEVKFSHPLSTLPLTGGRLMAMVMLVLTGFGLVVIAIYIRRSRQEI